MFMLDTNILVFSIRHPDSACAKKLSSHVGRDVCISVVTFAEMVYGVENSSDPKRNAEALNRFLAGIIILDFNMDAGIHYGRILAELRKKRLKDCLSSRSCFLIVPLQSGTELSKAANSCCWLLFRKQ